MGDSSRLLKHVRRLAAGDDPSDAGLVRRFASSSDPEAFAELVRRHGPAVLGVCRRVLGNDADADDAFQAAFLVLARKAGTVRRRRAVGSWLFGVARHVAVRLRDKHARRRRHERAAAAARSTEVLGPADDDLRAVLDDELARLPDGERAAVLACLVRGLTREQAAAELGWSLSTLRRRLDGGRERLRLRLARRLGEVPAGLLAGGAVAVSPTLAGVTVDGAILFAAGVRTGTPAVLAMGELAMMTRTKLAVLAGAVVAAAGMATGGAAVWPAAFADDPKPAAKADPPSSKPPDALPKSTIPARAVTADERIQPGERLRVSVFPGRRDLPLNDVFVVEPAGTLPLGAAYGSRVKVEDLTVEGAEAAILEHVGRALGSQGHTVEVVRLDAVAPAAPATDKIRPGDRLRIEASELAAGSSLKGEYRVEPSGKVPVGTYGRVAVAGLTVEQAEEAIRSRLALMFRDVQLLVTQADRPAGGGESTNAGDLAARVRRLEAEVAELKKTVAELRKK